MSPLSLSFLFIRGGPLGSHLALLFLRPLRSASLGVVPPLSFLFIRGGPLGSHLALWFSLVLVVFGGGEGLENLF